MSRILVGYDGSDGAPSVHSIARSWKRATGIELHGGRIWVESALGSRQPLHLHAVDRVAEL